MPLVACSWDLLEDPDQPWRPCLLERCRRFERGIIDRLPASLISFGMPTTSRNGSIPMFADGLRGGLILRPTPAEVRCAFPMDGSTRWKPDGCACPFIGDIKTGKAKAADCSNWCTLVAF